MVPISGSSWALAFILNLALYDQGLKRRVSFEVPLALGILL